MYEKLYRTYGPMVLRRCRRLLNNEADAFDAMQDVFVEVLRRYKVQDIQYPSSLLYQIATSVCLNKIRSEKRRGKIVSNSDDEIINNIAGLDSNESSWLLEKIFSRITKTQNEQTQVMLAMYLVDGMTLDSIGKHFNMSLSSVRRKIESAKSKFEDLRG